MNITKFIKATVDYFKYYSENPNDYTQQKDFIELVQNNNSILEMLIEDLWQPNKEVTVGQVIWSPNMAANRIAVVTVAGTTDATEPMWGDSSTTDNNVTYVMRDRVKLSSISLLDFRPIGSLYISFSPISPATLFGGAWERLEDGRIWLSAGTGYAVGSTGGEAAHKLTTAEIPSHTHDGAISGGSHNHTASSSSAGAHTHVFKFSPGYKSGTTYGEGDFGRNSGNGNATFNSADAHSHTVTINTSSSHSHTFAGGNSGSDTAHNNMQPWQAVYCWKRTA